MSQLRVTGRRSVLKLNVHFTQCEVATHAMVVASFPCFWPIVCLFPVWLSLGVCNEECSQRETTRNREETAEQTDKQTHTHTHTVSIQLIHQINYLAVPVGVTRDWGSRGMLPVVRVVGTSGSLPVRAAADVLHAADKSSVSEEKLHTSTK